MKLYFPHRKQEVLWNDSSVKPWIAQEEMEDWESKLFFFLQEWNSESPFIKAQTSGSTGIPKAILLKKENMCNSATMTIAHFNLKEHQNALLCLSVDFIAGKMMVIRAMLANLRIIAVEPSSSPLDSLTDSILDFVAMVPLQVTNSIQKLQNVRQLIIGGGIVNKQLYQQLQQTKTSCWSTYGMTETITHIAVKRLNGVKKSNAYTVLPNIKIQIDSRKCLVIDAPRITSEKVVTNDIVEVINPTTFRWLGRWDNVINSGGIKISPEEIENTITPFLSSPFFLAGVPDKKLENKLILIIESEAWKERKKQSFLDALQKELPLYKAPKELLFIPKFSYTISGKIKRKETLKLIT